MTELSFAKQFLTTLDSRSTRLSSDHVVDPKTYAPQPAFILPRMPTSKTKPTRHASIPGSTPALPTPTVTLKPTRAGAAPALTLPSAPLSTSMHDLKAHYAQHAGLPVEKIKLLHARKPVADSKTLRDVLEAGATPSETSSADKVAVEFQVMVIGGAAAASPAAAGLGGAEVTPERVASPPVVAPEADAAAAAAAAAASPNPPAEGQIGEEPVPELPSGAQVLRTEVFWEDLKAFLVQRLRDEGEGEKLAGLFKAAWEQQSS